ncbi:TPA: hypothetical protein DEP94_02850 [Candidatus Nomurabacteria bacterium]|nr:hypothetical protein [Candidatus Nomurabacteria bacterium]
MQSKVQNGLGTVQKSKVEWFGKTVRMKANVHTPMFASYREGIWRTHPVIMGESTFDVMKNGVFVSSERHDDIPKNFSGTSGASYCTDVVKFNHPPELRGMWFPRDQFELIE